MATYYIDAKNGNDGNSGTSEGSAWASLNKVNQQAFKPGDTILFHAGDVFKGMLDPSSSGTAGAPITFGSYGKGPAPVIDAGVTVADNAWTKVSGNVWQASVAKQGANDPAKVLFDGEAGNIQANGVSAVDGPGDWCWSGGKVYVYSAQNPGTAFDSVQVAVRDAGILINNVDHIRVQGLEVMLGREGVNVVGSNGTRLVDLNVHDSVRNGIQLDGSTNTLVDGGSSHHNGIDGEPGKMTHLGHGVHINKGAANNVVRGLDLHDNAEDGVQFGNSAGNGNQIVDNKIWGNREDGVDIKNGSQSFDGNQIYGNKENAILIHNTAQTITLTDNLLKTKESGNALDVSEGRVVSSGNLYEGVTSYSVEVVSKDGSSFKNDVFVDGGSNTHASVRIAGGSNTIADSTFVRHGDGVAIKADGGTVKVTGAEFYGNSATSGSVSISGSVTKPAAAWDPPGGIAGDAGNGGGGNGGPSGPSVPDDGGSDSGVGSAPPRTVTGTTGDDVLKGSAGSDTFVIGSPSGHDVIKGFDLGLDKIDLRAHAGETFASLKQDAEKASGNTILHLTDGSDLTLSGIDLGQLRDSHFVFGSSTPDSGTVRGTVKADKLAGTGGDDSLDGLAGNDTLDGKAGNDKLIGGGGNDKLIGGAGNDDLLGDAGRDVLRGGAGDDRLTGGSGNDVLSGHQGRDTFVFSRGGGADVIKDFQPGVDIIDVSAFGLAGDRTAFLDSGVDGRGGATFDLGGGTGITLANVSVDDLSPQDVVM